MSGQTWTPAPKKGVIPLHPMTFGMILGRAFSALRHNPKVLFGFAVAVQFAITVLAVVVTLFVAGFTAARIASVPQGSPDFGPIVAGSIALGALIGIAVTLASVAFTAVVQGLVAADVSFAAIGRKAPLRMLWARMRPAFWRLFAFSLLQGAAVFLWILVIGAIIFGVMAATGFDGAAIGISIVLALLVIFGSIPLFVWLGTKLLVVPSTLVLEGASIRGALVRSWRLTRGRFWVALGIMFLIGAIMGLAAQVVSFPGMIISSVVGGVVSPTGADDASAVVALIAATVLPQILVLAVQAITLVVQGTGATLIYLDSRMRYEGLDQTLISYVERSQLGVSDEELGDPYAVDEARAVTKEPPVQRHAPAPGYAPYNPQGYAAPAQGYPGQPGYAPQGYARQGYAPQQGYPQPPASPAPTPGYAPPQPGYAAPPQGYPQPHNQAAPPPPAAPPAAPQPAAQDQSASAPAESTAPNPWTAPGSSA